MTFGTEPFRAFFYVLACRKSIPASLLPRRKHYDSCVAPTSRLLIAEDNPHDAELEPREFRRAGLRMAHQVVDSAEAFTSALRSFAPDIILSDFSMPATELEIARERLKEREAGLSRAQAMAKLAHVITGEGGGFESWSETLPRLLRLKPFGMPGATREWVDMLHPDDRDRFRAKTIEASESGARTDIEYRLRRADGEWIHLRQVMAARRRSQHASREPTLVQHAPGCNGAEKRRGEDMPAQACVRGA
jgi:PAS domain-containing protein